MAARSSKCKACGGRTTASGGYCQSCKSLRHHGYKRVKEENLLLDQAGGSWWIWNQRGDVLVSGKPTASEAVIALGVGQDLDEEVTAHGHATKKKTSAQLDREITEHLRRYGLPNGRSKGRHPREFDPIQLRRGVQVEMEHTSDRGIAERIAMDHLVEDPLYYVKLAKIHVD